MMAALELLVLVLLALALVTDAFMGTPLAVPSTQMQGSCKMSAQEQPAAYTPLSPHPELKELMDEADAARKPVHRVIFMR